MAEIEPDEELVEGAIGHQELVAILNGMLATLDLVADLAAQDDERLAERLDLIMDDIADLIEDIGGDLYDAKAIRGLTDSYLQEAFLCVLRASATLRFLK